MGLHIPVSASQISVQEKWDGRSHPIFLVRRAGSAAGGWKSRPNLMEVKGSEAQGRRREAGPEGSVEQRCGPMYKNRIRGLTLILQQKSAAGVILTEVRKAQTVRASSRTSNSWGSLRQPISFG